jgi:hypothetical protein
LSLGAPVREALKFMCEDNVPGVPVVGEDGALEGFVTDGYLSSRRALPRYMRLMDNLSYVARSFYHRKYDAVKTLEAFSTKLRDRARTPVPADAARCPKLLKGSEVRRTEGRAGARALAPHRSRTPRLPVPRAPPSPQVVQYREDEPAPQEDSADEEHDPCSGTHRLTSSLFLRHLSDWKMKAIPMTRTHTPPPKTRSPLAG